MKIFKFGCIVLIAFSAACSNWHSRFFESPKWISGGDVFCLSIEEKERYQNLFLDHASRTMGDAIAAWKLYKHFGQCMVDEAKADYWLRRSAELGYPQAAYELGMMLTSYNPLGTIPFDEGLFWLEQGAKLKHEKSRELFRSLMDVKSSVQKPLENIPKLVDKKG